MYSSPSFSFPIYFPQDILSLSLKYFDFLYYCKVKNMISYAKSTKKLVPEWHIIRDNSQTTLCLEDVSKLGERKEHLEYNEYTCSICLCTRHFLNLFGYWRDKLDD